MENGAKPIRGGEKGEEMGGGRTGVTHSFCYVAALASSNSSSSSSVGGDVLNVSCPH